jgi:hypothetical protein
MTEEDWFTSTEPQRMLTDFSGNISARKLRLFAVACCRRIAARLTDERSLLAVGVAENFADGLATEEECRTAHAHAVAASLEHAGPEFYAAAMCTVPPSAAKNILLFSVQQLAGVAVSAVVGPANAWELVTKNRARWTKRKIEEHRQALLLRDIVGNPFCSVELNSAWRTPTVTSLAAAVYENRQLPSGRLDHQRLGVLGDALEEIGCDNADVLDHLRGDGEHVRGCWALDLLLSR